MIRLTAIAVLLAFALPAQAENKKVTVTFLGGAKKTPLEGLKVSVRLSTGHSSEDDRRKPVTEGKTKKDGAISFTLAGGLYYLDIDSDKELPYIDRPVGFKHPPNNYSRFIKVEKDQAFEFNLADACKLTLRAVDADTGQGIPGVVFVNENALGEDWALPIHGDNLGAKKIFEGHTDESLKTDKDGNFTRFMGARDGYTYPEGQPFPWLVSDFGLVDAIESGLVKIPRLPVSDDAKKKDDVGRPDPKYFRLWYNIVGSLSPAEKFGSGKPKPDACYREAEGALKQIAGQWLERFKYIQEATPDQVRVPPVLIVVCDNIEIADYFYRKISGEGESDSVTIQDVEDVESGEDEETTTVKRDKAKKQVVYEKSAILDEYANTAHRKLTHRIDSKTVEEVESIRKVIATVGRVGEPGEHVRCVVSVAMLTEGWDANNVTHILGIRAFRSKLLCEQVVGRGLRRMNYEPDPTTGLLIEEYVDVYGIPFSVIPFKGRAVNQKTPEDKPKHRVWAVPDRDNMVIRFPIVEGYVFQMTKGLIRCNVDEVEILKVNSKQEPTTTFLRSTAGYVDTQAAAIIPFEFVRQDRTSYYAQTHFQTILFRSLKKLLTIYWHRRLRRRTRKAGSCDCNRGISCSPKF